MNEEEVIPTEPTEPEPTEPEPVEPEPEPVEPEPEFDHQQTYDLLLENLPPISADSKVSADTAKELLELLKLDESSKNTKAILEIMEQNELEEAEAKALAEAEASEAEQAALEAGEPVDYEKLAYEEILLQTEILQEQSEYLENANTMVAEQSLMVVIAIVVTMGMKVFIDQVTKW